MKAKLLLVLTCIFSAAILFLANSAGEGYVQGVDRTGSPFSSGSCNNCHSEGNFTPKVFVSLLRDTQIVNSYQPGQSYTIRIRVQMPFGNAGDYGFQAIALMGADNLNAGTFGKLPDGLRLTTLRNNRIYVEHSRPSISNTINIPWIAPPSGSGSVSIYACGVAANGAGAADGQGASRLDNPIVIAEGTATGTQSIQAAKFEVSLFPNPVQNELQLKVSNSSFRNSLNVRISSLDGQTVFQSNLQNAGSNFQTTILTQEWISGLYLVSLSDGCGAITKMVFKQ
jgi:hypothetical protein